MALPWPESHQHLKEVVHSQWGIKGEIEILREFGEGLSSAKVFVVDLNGENYQGQAILKLDYLREWTMKNKTESEFYAQAALCTPDYAQKHLPKLLNSYEHEGFTALLCSIAGNSLNYVQALLNLGSEQQHGAIKQITRGILEDWNKDYKVSNTACPHVALDSWLGYRIDPVQGRISDFLQDRCGLEKTRAAFSINGQWFPNPYAYANSREFWPTRHEIKLVKGRSHGDLHGKNVLVKIEGLHNYKYFLIDLALYQENSYLFYDQAYLELSHLLHYRGNAQICRWLQILEGLTMIDPLDIDTGKVDIDDQGLLAILRSARLEIQQWVLLHESGRQDHMRGQAMLARVAAGLNFVNKEIDDRRRRLAFLYASAHLKQYFNTFHIKWNPQGPVLNFQDSVEAPKTDEWREVWNACEHFDRHKNAYVLVSGPDVRQLDPMGLQVLGRIPWSLVLDFDSTSKQGGLFEAVRPTLKGYRTPHETLLGDNRDINYREATCWFMAAGISQREDTLKPNYDDWRRHYIPAIRNLVHGLRMSMSPQPVLVLILNNGLIEQYLRATWECLDEVFADEAHYVVVDDGKTDSGNIREKHAVTLVPCPLQNLTSGLWQMYGDLSPHQKVHVPRRGITDNERTSIVLEDEDIQYLKEDLEVIHGGLVQESQEGERIGHDFLRGHEITWTELDMGTDIRRDCVEQLKKEIITRLDESRNASIQLDHTPGSGGTTLAKRIAWDLKDIYPTVRIHNFSSLTVSRIEMLFHKTKLPVFVLMEAADVSPPAREQLFKDLKGRNARAVFLYIVRSIKLKGEFTLQDPMTKQEADRFYKRYESIALEGRRGDLLQLANDEDMKLYRSPFFFGLYAFEEEFVHVPDFVRAHLATITPDVRKIICFLSLVTRFSQSTLPSDILRKLLDISPSRSLRLDEVFGDGPARLVLHRGGQARIIHPLIAEEILNQSLTPGNSDNKNEWKTMLADLCCLFIDSLINIAGSDSTTLLKIFSQMFISRDPWQERTDRRRHFSDLILTIPNEGGQHRVLRKLRDSCPTEAHFWNHLGRHHIYVMRSRYTEAEENLLKAIELDPENDIHHHALGMAYRFEIRRKFKELIVSKATDEDGLNAVRELTAKAELCFEKARKLDQETEHGYITNIQLLIESIEKLYRLSGCQNYATFLTKIGSVGDWCRNTLPRAAELLRRVKSLQAHENLSRLTVVCEGKILNFYGHFDFMIDGLQNLLRQKNIHPSPIRRAMANAYYAHRGHNWKNMKDRDLNKIYTLMAENLEEDPANVPDLMIWFQAYRRLRSFDMLEAIDRLSGWAMREESIEAHYYLYILHFLRWRQGILNDHRLVTQHITKCRDLAGKIRRTHSFEWMANEPEWCSLAHYSELGKWDGTLNFYENTDSLKLENGTIKLMKGPQSGLLALGPLEAFFVPGNEFLPGRDENQAVQFYLGFSYVGLRAWMVRHSK